MRQFLHITGLLLAFYSGIATAQVLDQQDAMLAEFEVKTGLQVLAAADAPLPNLLTLKTTRGVFYISRDGAFVFQGAILNVAEGFRNETEIVQNEYRAERVASIAPTGILYKAKNEKYRIDIFTDISCGYCRKLHRELEDYLDAGISVNYLAFPRMGLNSDVYKDMVSVWCASNPQDAMTNAKLNSDVTARSCSTQVAEHYRVGASIGVSGTPNIILSNGTVIPGYQPAAQLLARLDSMAQ